MNILNKDTTHTTYNYKLKFYEEEIPSKSVSSAVPHFILHYKHLPEVSAQACKRMMSLLNTIPGYCRSKWRRQINVFMSFLIELGFYELWLTLFHVHNG